MTGVPDVRRGGAALCLRSWPCCHVPLGPPRWPPCRPPGLLLPQSRGGMQWLPCAESSQPLTEGGPGRQVDIGPGWTCRNGGRAALARKLEGQTEGQMCWGAIREGLAHVRLERSEEGAQSAAGVARTPTRAGGWRLSSSPTCILCFLLGSLGWGGGLPFRGDAHL